jgi:hypothetical protein
VGDVGTPASLRIIDVDPISSRPGGWETTWSRTRRRLTRRREVRGRLAHKYLILSDEPEVAATRN